MALDQRLLAEHVVKELKAGRRLPAAHGAFNSIPTVVIQRDVVADAIASCVVRIRGSLAIAALTAEVAPMDRGEGDSAVVEPAGRIRFAVTTSPTAEVQSLGHVREQQTLRGRLVAAHLNELYSGKAFDLGQLRIAGSDEACWQINVDVRFMELDGEVYDIATVAAAALLRRFVIPAAEIADGTVTEDVVVQAAQLPVTLSSALVCGNGTTLVSPSSFENAAADAHIRVSVDAIAHKVVRVEHGGGFPATWTATEAAAKAAVAFATTVTAAAAA